MRTLIFKLAGGLHVLVYRLTNGRIGGRMFGMETALVTVRGRKSGAARTVPLTFFRDGESMVLVASAGGQPRNPGWYHNLKAADDATVQLLDRRMRVRVEELTPEETEAFWPRVLETAPMYGGYREKTTRRIPMLRLTPDL